MNINLTLLQSRHCQDVFLHTVFTSVQGSSVKWGRDIYTFVTIILSCHKAVKLMLIINFVTVLQARRSQVQFLMGSWRFCVDLILEPHYGPGVDSASNWNEYQGYWLVDKGSWFIGLTTLPPPCAKCVEMLRASAS